MSIELDLEEIKQLAGIIGFEISVRFFWIDSALNLSLSLSIIKHERTIDTTYTHNNRGMLSYTYHAAFWVATKRRDVRGKETRTE